LPAATKKKASAIHFAISQGQDYQGLIRVIVVDNASIDKTAENGPKGGRRLGIDIQVLLREKPGSTMR
jgi:hypothetical protein